LSYYSEFPQNHLISLNPGSDNKKSSPIGKPLNIVLREHKTSPAYLKGKYDGDGCVFFVSLSSKNKRVILNSKINFEWRFADTKRID